MSFDTPEISNDDGEIVHFYRFEWGNTHWFYTNAVRDLDVLYKGSTDTYSKAVITNSDVTSGGDRNSEITLTVDDGLPVIGLFRGTPPSENVKVTVLRRHQSDPEVGVLFVGKIDNVGRDGKGRAKVLCSTGKQNRAGLRLTWSRTCPHVLYDGQCRLLLADFEYSATVSAVTGVGFTVSAEPLKDGLPADEVGFFDGGMVAWDADGLGTLERRAIESGSSTTEFQIFGRADGIEVGQAVLMHPGCDKLDSTCDDKFNNLVNYGGVQLPGESPYGVNLF